MQSNDILEIIVPYFVMIYAYKMGYYRAGPQ